MKNNRILTWCLAFSVLLCSVMGCTQAEPTAVPTSAPTAAPTEAPTEEPTTEKEALPVPIVEKGQSDYVIIYSAELDDDDTDSSTAESNTDLEVDLAKQVRSLIKTLTGCELALSTDAEAPAKHEILIGTTNREESREFLDSIAIEEYGAAVIGEKIVMGAWNLTTLTSALKEFKDLVNKAVLTESDGTKSLVLTTESASIWHSNGWYTSFPAFPDGELYGTYDCANNVLEYLYTKVAGASVTSYVKTLEGNGFKQMGATDFGGNPAYTYTGADGMVHLIYHPSDETLQLITAPEGKYVLPPSMTGDAPEYETVTEPKITQFPTRYKGSSGSTSYGMGYILTLSDGSFVVIDGGGSGGISFSQRFLKLLRELNERPDGQIVIAAWILTHEHGDHFGNFSQFIQTFGSQVTVEKMYMNLPVKSAITNSSNPEYGVTGNFADIQKAAKGAEMVKLHTGMRFEVRDAVFDVLFTQDDIYPGRCHFFNETSLVFRMELGGTSVLWTGDSRDYATDSLLLYYVPYASSDIVQVSHHGFVGLRQELYEAIPAKLLLWPNSQAGVDWLKTGTRVNHDVILTVDKYLYDTYGPERILVAEKAATIRLPYHEGDEFEYRDYN
ncbi:MAG: MBL fold metallo-hydrolase [Lachnospiraceae bacterium]|nr:MBL fold metallo-hydrolase [Lachnospiraceae bacterium]